PLATASRTSGLPVAASPSSGSDEGVFARTTPDSLKIVTVVPGGNNWSPGSSESHDRFITPNIIGDRLPGDGDSGTATVSAGLPLLPISHRPTTVLPASRACASTRWFATSDVIERPTETTGLSGPITPI